jgi:hypothetical protein
MNVKESGRQREGGREGGEGRTGRLLYLLVEHHYSRNQHQGKIDKESEKHSKRLHLINGHFESYSLSGCGKADEKDEAP